MIKSAVLTGPTGVLGTALVKKLATENIETYVVCHPGSKRNAAILEHPCIHKVECDMSEICRLPKLIGEKVDAFFHLAWLGTANHNNRMDMHLQTSNIAYTLDAVEAARDMECQVFIGAGSQAEYGHIDGVIHSDTREKPISGYGMAKLCAGQMTRQMCQDYGIRHIWTRVVSTYGPGDNPNTLISVVVRKLLAGEKPSLTAGEQIWDYLYADDAAEAFYQMALHGRNGSVYVLGSGQTKPLREFMEIVRNEIDPSLPLGIGEIPYYQDQAMHLEADIGELIRDTGWRPTTSFEKGIQRLVDYTKELMKLQKEQEM